MSEREPAPEQPERDSPEPCLPASSWWWLWPWALVALLIVAGIAWLLWSHRPIDHKTVARLADEVARLTLEPPL